MGTFEARLPFVLMPDNFHMLSITEFQLPGQYNHFIKIIFTLLLQSFLRISYLSLIQRNLELKTDTTLGRENLLAAKYTLLLSLLSALRTNFGRRKKYDFRGYSHVCPWQVAFSCAVAPFTILADNSSTYQSLCTHWHDIAIYPFQGVAGLCFMGPGFC